ncbi:CDP-glycerol glycerophosphotransferase family protein [Seleniivibrio sp.]|uniref:CDP-glycerol glycerophosphotransferase family protein n=1 Tax=Seleniivibrio sp. TaxID=2898801 RepID=UPI0025FDB3A5|nr:CDP-glycerol glycerophosphotransferase family protein [Seleniivibrio sp.]MCD8553575.1 CDP-glycerol glycerophosphotransferase family protein [Seleniivibrio sp.]
MESEDNKIILYPAGAGGRDAADIFSFYGFDTELMDDNSHAEGILSFEEGIKAAKNKNTAIVVNSDKYGVELYEKVARAGISKVFHYKDYLKKMLNGRLKKIAGNTDGAKTVAIFCPNSKKPLGDIPEHLSGKGVKTVFLTHIRKDYESGFYNGGALLINPAHITMLEGIDLMIMTDGVPVPVNTKSLFIHHALDYSSALSLNSDSSVSLETYYKAEFDFSEFNFASCRSTFELTKKLTSIVKEYYGDKRERCIIPGGYPSFDQNLAKFKEMSKETVRRDTILYAPTPDYVRKEDIVKFTGANTSFPSYSKDIIEALLENFPEYRVVFRIHPLHNKNPHIDSILNGINNNNFVYDDGSGSYMETFSRSTFLVSDISSVAYNFPLTTLRPTIFFNPVDFPSVVRAADTELKLSFVEHRERVGHVAKNIDEMLFCAKKILETPDDVIQSGLKNFRDEFMFNIGKSAEYLADNIEYIIEGKKHPDWCYI